VPEVRVAHLEPVRLLQQKVAHQGFLKIRSEAHRTITVNSLVNSEVVGLAPEGPLEAVHGS
jgi:hypothetical protein